ncbi:MAG: trypsin-like peptidase domain-containing protein [Alicyclobacillus sp.]|nr:trypsin-like peptidase domain-containing protein [Alicyclobacillus sp.]
MNTAFWRWFGVAGVSALIGATAALAAGPWVWNLAEAGATSSPAVAAANVQTTPAVANVTVTDGIEQVVKKVEPAVVGVVDYTTQSPDTWFSTSTSGSPTESGVGTGVIFAKDSQWAYVVTNNHVVDGADKVEVVLGSGKHLPATVVGTDMFTDLAVLKVPVADVKNVTPVQFGDSDNLQAGEPAIAIGTPMGLDFADTVTAGIVSAPKRVMPVEEPDTNQVLDYQTVIQTDAAINPGNSGGPLLNIAGQVIGINSSKIVAEGVEGMGFAIPARVVQNVAYQILQTGHAVHPAIGVEGYSLASLPAVLRPDVPVDYGVWVRTVTSPQASAAGLRPQDVIVAVDGHTVQSAADLRTYVFDNGQVGKTVQLTVYRGSQKLTLTVPLTDMNQVSNAPQTAPASPYGN